MSEFVTTRWSSTNKSDRFDVTDPSTGEVIRTVQGGAANEVDGAVRAAHAAFNMDWRTRRDRGVLLQEISRRVKAQAKELAALESRENGKPLDQAMGDVMISCILFDYFGGLAGKLPGEHFDGGLVYGSTLLEPYGVVGAIVPFNWPPIHTASKIAPALAVGNTVVLKPPEQTPSVIMRIVEIAQEVLPPDVLHVVPGGREAGNALASHKLVRKISFTGAPGTGSAVIKASADNHTPTLMELGGKNAMIVLQDADVDYTMKFLLDAGYFNQGEACTAGSRVLVQRSLYDTLVNRLGAAVKKLRVGAATEPGVHIGPLVNRAQQQRVLDYLSIARDEGAIIAAQAELPRDERLANGFWVKPTLISNVHRDMRIAREEIFGPVVVVIPFDTVEEAISITNDTEFGLTCAIFTRNHALGMRIAREVDAGMIFVNNYYRMGISGMPFGGCKASGYGREGTLQTLKEYGRTKLIVSPSGLGDFSVWGAKDLGL